MFDNFDPDKENLGLNVSKEAEPYLESIQKLAKARSRNETLATVVVLTRWVFERRKEGRVVAALSIDKMTYTELESSLFQAPRIPLSEEEFFVGSAAIAEWILQKTSESRPIVALNEGLKTYIELENPTETIARTHRSIDAAENESN